MFIFGPLVGIDMWVRVWLSLTLCFYWPPPTPSSLHFRRKPCKLETQQKFLWAPLILVLPIFLSQSLRSTLPSWTEKKENDLIYQITNLYSEFKLLGKFNVLPLQDCSFPCGKIWNYSFKLSKLDLSREARMKEEHLESLLENWRVLC